jgi:hypothetical protein
MFQNVLLAHREAHYNVDEELMSNKWTEFKLKEEEPIKIPNTEVCGMGNDYWGLAKTLNKMND